ncbi:EF-hand domain-containing protein [Sphingomonas tabacisoli]|uniref:EF-hand domain-containing protein n=1 Tax=Sphingomonas tabacisoli TaxID=2249466 RepID=A0ABW4I1K7_9SPHN
MRRTAVLVVGVLLCSAAGAQMGPPGGGGGGRGGGQGRHGGFGGGPGGERMAPRPPKPLKRKRLDEIVTAMFRAADANHDGMVTLDELHAVIEARREAAIRARFERIDRNHDGRIDLDEFAAWQRAMGSAALSDAQSTGVRGAMVPEEIGPELGNDPEDRRLARFIEPLSAPVLVNANTNYDAGVSLEELLAYERKRFDAADANHDGELTIDELGEGFDPQGAPGRGAGAGRGGYGRRGRPGE